MLSLHSAGPSLVEQLAPGCPLAFELFGYDFMVDEDEQVWLLEINSCPCLEESSAHLKRIMPKMLD